MSLASPARDDNFTFMSSTAATREIYVLGKKAHGNREEVIIGAGQTHDLPAAAKYPYSDVQTRFPYEIPA